MTTTLTDGITTVTLTDDLLRTDEHAWSPVRQSIAPTLTGALFIDVSVMQAGEPITLAGGIDRDGFPYGIITRADFATLRGLADLPGQVFTLTYRGFPHIVVWRHEDAPALDARDLIDYADPVESDWVVPTLKFTRIA